MMRKLNKTKKHEQVLSSIIINFFSNIEFEITDLMDRMETQSHMRADVRKQLWTRLCVFKKEGALVGVDDTNICRYKVGNMNLLIEKANPYLGKYHSSMQFLKYKFCLEYILTCHKNNAQFDLKDIIKAASQNSMNIEMDELQSMAIRFTIDKWIQKMSTDPNDFFYKVLLPTSIQNELRFVSDSYVNSNNFKEIDVEVQDIPETTVNTIIPEFPLMTDEEVGGQVIDYINYLTRTYISMKDDYDKCLESSKGLEDQLFKANDRILSLNDEIKELTSKLTKLQECANRNVNRRTLEIKPLPK